MEHGEARTNLEAIIRIDSELNLIQDLDLLLERILLEARRVVRADAGSIYEKEKDRLVIKYAQNDTKQKELPPGQKLIYSVFTVPINEKTISGYCALKGSLVNVQDVYTIPTDAPYSYNTSFDRISGYRTTSNLTVPLKTAEGKLLGVIQVINARDDARAVHRAAVAAVEDAGLTYSAALAEHQSVQALVSALRSALTKMAAASYGPIEAAARRLYDGSGLPAPYFAGLDDYGADVPGRGRVPFLGLSQAEGNVTAAALVCALAVVSGQPCRLVLLDGIEVMQADHRPLLLAALVRAVERGDVDNVIVTMSTSGKAEVADEQEAEISMPGVTIRRVPFVPLPEVDVEPEPLPPRPVPTQAPAPVVESGEVEIPF